MTQTQKADSAPLVSVLVPLYNVEAFVAESLASMSAQTWPNLEILVWDDGSSDGTARIVEQLAAFDPRIRLHRCDANRGITHALNELLGWARGTLIARFDGDDVAHPERIECQVRALLADPCLGLVGCWLETIDEHGRPLGRTRYPRAAWAVALCARFSPPVAHVWVARREVYDQLHGYRALPYAEDYDFVLRALACGWKIANVDLYGVKVRLRSGNSLSSAGLMQRKAASLTRELAAQRRRTGTDDLDERRCNLRARLAASPREVDRFARARAALQKAIASGRPAGKLHAAAALGCPWMTRYLLGRVAFRLVARLS